MGAAPEAAAVFGLEVSLTLASLLVGLASSSGGSPATAGPSRGPN
jgi:hypothetical protein